MHSLWFCVEYVASLSRQDNHIPFCSRRAVKMREQVCLERWIENSHGTTIALISQSSIELYLPGTAYMNAGIVWCVVEDPDSMNALAVVPVWNLVESRLLLVPPHRWALGFAGHLGADILRSGLANTIVYQTFGLTCQKIVLVRRMAQGNPRRSFYPASAQLFRRPNAGRAFQELAQVYVDSKHYPGIKDCWSSGYDCRLPSYRSAAESGSIPGQFKSSFLLSNGWCRLFLAAV
jgi:hypothetical protein